MEFQPGSKTQSGYLALPPSGTGPGVLVLHAWWGLNGFFIELCDRLAREGFVALAPDIYGGATATTIEEAEQLIGGVQAAPEAAQARYLEALDALREHPAVQGQKVGTLGCSMGAYWGLLLSALRPEEIAATVLFYSVGDADFTVARSAYLGHFAENDTWDPLEQARQMEADMRVAGREITFYAYPGVGHWFFEADRPDAYDAESAQLAWERTVPFLQDHLPVK